MKTNSLFLLDIRNAIIAFENGRGPASAVAQSVERYAPLLEGVSRDVRDRLHALSVLIIAQDVTPVEADMLGLAPSHAALDELKLLLQTLDDSATP